MSVSPEGDKFEGQSEWFAATVSAAQRTLDDVRYSVKRETTELFAQRIQKIIDQTNDGECSVSQVASLSLYVDLLRKYENNGAFCDLRELSDRLSAHELKFSTLQNEELSEAV